MDFDIFYWILQLMLLVIWIIHPIGDNFNYKLLNVSCTWITFHINTPSWRNKLSLLLLNILILKIHMQLQLIHAYNFDRLGFDIDLFVHYTCTLFFFAPLWHHWNSNLISIVWYGIQPLIKFWLSCPKTFLGPFMCQIHPFLNKFSSTLKLEFEWINFIICFFIWDGYLFQITSRLCLKTTTSHVL